MRPLANTFLLLPLGLSCLPWCQGREGEERPLKLGGKRPPRDDEAEGGPACLPCTPALWCMLGKSMASAESDPHACPPFLGGSGHLL